MLNNWSHIATNIPVINVGKLGEDFLQNNVHQTNTKIYIKINHQVDINSMSIVCAYTIFYKTLLGL